MGATSFSDEHRFPIFPSKIFKDSVVDSHNLIPKLIPQVTESVEIIEGDGGTGSIKQTTFAEGSNFKSIECSIDELNQDTLTYMSTLVERDPLVDKAGKERVLAMHKAAEACLLQNLHAYA